METEGCRDGTLKAEAGGGAASGLNTSHLPPRHQPFWATDPQIRDSVKSILPHACQRCVCFSSLEGHLPSISIRLRVLIERRPALTSDLLITHYEKGLLGCSFSDGVSYKTKTITGLAAKELQERSAGEGIVFLTQIIKLFYYKVRLDSSNDATFHQTGFKSLTKPCQLQI